MAGIKNMLFRMVNRNRWIRRIAKHLIRGFWRGCYLAVRLVSRTDEKLCVFEVYQGRQYTCSPRAIYEEMKSRESLKDYRFIWVFRKPEDYRWLEDGNHTRIVKLGSLHYYRAFAKAKYWVVNSRTRHCLVPGKDQIFLQTWHGTPLKRLGCDIDVEGNNVVSLKEMRKDYQREGERVTYFLSPSPFYTEKIGSAFALSKRERKEKIVELGYPRNDALFRADDGQIQKIRRKLKLPEGKRVLLYAPTFRDNAHTKDGCAFSLGLDLDQFVKELGDTFVMLFRTHYFITEQIDLTLYQNVVFDVTSWEDINELYLVSDLLVTDYSSVFFDYANLRKPILFYMYDLEEYQSQIRDFYLKLTELPGEIVTNQEALFVKIREVGKERKPKQQYEKFCQRFNPLDGPHTAGRVVDWLLQREERR